jgi:hypothetical protein
VSSIASINCIGVHTVREDEHHQIVVNGVVQRCERAEHADHLADRDIHVHFHIAVKSVQKGVQQTV